MAKRNRKNGEEGHRTMVWGISLFGVAAVLAGIYLGLFNACETIGRQIKKLEYDQAELRKRVVKLTQFPANNLQKEIQSIATSYLNEETKRRPVIFVTISKV